VFEGVDDLVLDLADLLLEFEFTLLALLFEVRTGLLTMESIRASERRTVTIESVGNGDVFLGISTKVVAL
jgi:hypothetical protein